MKDFTNDNYENIKKVLKDNKISSNDLNKYLAYKELRYLRYREIVPKDTDDSILEDFVNGISNDKTTNLLETITNHDETTIKDLTLLSINRTNKVKKGIE